MIEEEYLTEVTKEDVLGSLRMIIGDLVSNSEKYREHVIKASLDGGMLEKYVIETENVGDYLETQYEIDKATLKDLERVLSGEDLLRSKKDILKLRKVLDSIRDMKTFFEYGDHVRNELDACENSIIGVLDDLKRNNIDPKKVKDAILKCDEAIGKVDHRVFGIRRLFENTVKKLREEHKLFFRPL